MKPTIKKPDDLNIKPLEPDATIVEKPLINDNILKKP